MSLTLMEQLETQEEGFSLTDIVELAEAHSAAQPLDDANIPADDLLTLFTENDFEDKEARDALDSPEATLYVDEADRTEPEEGSELGNALSLYLREIGRVRRLTAQEEIRLALLAHQGKLEQQRALRDNTLANDNVMQKAKEAQRRLIEANLRLVVSIAKKYQNRGLALHDLSEREREILQLRYGLLDDTSHSLTEIGELLHVSRQRVRQIEMKALQKLRVKRSDQLKDFLN